ncbi:hypothetical protein DQ04_14771010 [Trypanosoma grayi]|uniref:hypothetical protein n=1 Tax=Trypanosoma grayi TaxID=71804 RepID=UPI0004F3FD79|nr:hypothetical protein DQ04_14771010 [Trypanosoma grayi]KEG06296.1 hypothetical protein DQ04_14771010 [Trypanosoma grayi]
MLLHAAFMRTPAPSDTSTDSIRVNSPLLRAKLIVLPPLALTPPAEYSISFVTLSCVLPFMSSIEPSMRLTVEWNATA